MKFLSRLGLTRKLVLFNLLIFAPFMGFRVLRTAGDDKVYVAQAFEMVRDDHWFVQTLADQPDYYKGPLHYILVRIGTLLFGHTMWATLYMNLLLLIVASISLGKLMERFYPARAGLSGQDSERESWAVWAGGAFACSIGVYLHAYASQMEVELACAYSIAAYLLSRANEKRFEYLFWITAGVAGWFKSPLHSVFISAAALIYWLLTGELLSRIKRGRTWGALSVGALVGAAGYLPAYLLDKENFMRTYLVRETFNKGPSGELWFSPVWPILTFFLLPWMLMAFVAYADGLTRVFREAKENALGSGGRRLIYLGFAFLVPCMAFFIWFPYRAQNYTLPAAGAWLIAIGAVWASAGPSWVKVYRASVAFMGFVFLGAGGFAAVLGAHYETLPPEWPAWVIPFLVIGGFATGALWVKEAFRRGIFSPERILVACLPFYLSLGALYAVLGEREMQDLKHAISASRDLRCEDKAFTVGYFNLQRKLWSEWGYLNYMVSFPIEGLHTEAALLRAIASHQLILVAEKYNLDATIALAARKFPGLEPVTRVWHRWKTQGRGPDGSTLWQASWDSRDLRQLEAEYSMVRFKPKGMASGQGCD